LQGNHDFNENNVEEVDTISPVVELINDDRITYYKEGKCYEYDENIVFAVYSVFEHCAIPVDLSTKKKHILIVQSLVYITHLSEGLKQMLIPKYSVNLKLILLFLKGCDVVMMGDIHKYQVIWHTVEGKPKFKCVYSSSLIQQNYGENVENHGYVLWDMERLEHKLVPITTDYGYYKLMVKSVEDVEKG
jgi:hypothetical protein